MKDAGMCLRANDGLATIHSMMWVYTRGWVLRPSPPGINVNSHLTQVQYHIVTDDQSAIVDWL